MLNVIVPGVFSVIVMFSVLLVPLGSVPTSHIPFSESYM